ncbi:MAG: hypothetical protein HGA78_06560, partial [Nitrospirales bacterium]|nr:hypothetical protein [Nitrospirales bacterium]
MRKETIQYSSPLDALVAVAKRLSSYESRLGSGAVMGDKKVKAVVVRGTKDINVADGPGFISALRDLRAFVEHRNANPLST